MKFYYARLVKPQQIQLGTSGKDTPIFCNCAECGAKDAIIFGQIKDVIEHQVARFKNDDGITMTAACYCESCFEQLLNTPVLEGKS